VEDGDKDRTKNCVLDLWSLKLFDGIGQKRVKEFLHKFVYRLL
jgi:hypothetical protein